MKADLTNYPSHLEQYEARAIDESPAINVRTGEMRVTPK
jgi:hypothetical protein